MNKSSVTSQRLLEDELEWWENLHNDTKHKLMGIFDEEWWFSHESLTMETRASYAKLASDLFLLMEDGLSDAHSDDKYVGFAPLMLRTSFHSSGTYHQPTGTGGSNGGTIFHPAELSDANNACIEKATILLESLAANSTVPFADAAIIAGVVALDVMQVSFESQVFRFV